MQIFLGLSFLMLTIFLSPSYASEDSIAPKHDVRALLKQARIQIDENIKVTGLQLPEKKKDNNTNIVSVHTEYRPFETLPKVLLVHLLGYVEDQHLPTLSICDKKMRFCVMESSRSRLQANPNSSWVMPFIELRGKDQVNYLIALHQQHYINQAWSVIRGTIVTGQLAEPSWLSWMAGKKLNLEWPFEHPLRLVTLNILKSLQGEKVVDLTRSLSDSLSASEVEDERASAAELLSIYHMMSFPEKSSESGIRKLYQIFLRQKEKVQLEMPQGFETSRKYAMQAAELGRPQALESLILTQFDFSRIPVQDDYFFSQPLEVVAPQLYTTKQQNGLLRKLTSIMNTENLERFNRAFDLAISLSKYTNDDKLRQLSLFYHYCSITFIQSEKYSLLQKFVLRPLVKTVTKESPAVLQKLVKNIQNEVHNKGIQLEPDLQTLINQKWNDL